MGKFFKQGYDLKAIKNVNKLVGTKLFPKSVRKAKRSMEIKTGKPVEQIMAFGHTPQQFAKQEIASQKQDLLEYSKELKTKLKRTKSKKNKTRITEELTEIPAYHKEIKTTERAINYQDGKILSPSKGDVVKKLNTGQKFKLTSQDRQAINSTILGHELDELKKGKKFIMKNQGKSPKGRRSDPSLGGYLGHRSPEVLFREHNRLTTMGSELKGAKKFLKKERSGSYGHGTILNKDLNKAKVKNFNFGKSERLSRHAIKRITEILAKQ